MKRSKYRQLFSCLLLILVVGLTGCKTKEGGYYDDTVLLMVNGQETELKEGELYLELTRKSFEEIGGTEIWEMDLDGHDPALKAKENALNSLIRVKVLAQQYKSTAEVDAMWITRGIVNIRETVGSTWLNEHEITDEDLYDYILDSYKAYQYEKSLSFVAGSYEGEIEEKIETQFVDYANMDKEAYLRTVSLEWVMIYTGEWISGNWVAYPDSEQEELYRGIEEAKALIDRGAKFYQVAALYSDDQNDPDRENPLFYEGVVQNQNENAFYYGQIQSDLASQLFKIPSGETSEILETEYGYLIVKVEGFSEPTRASLISYEKQLREAKLKYRESLMDELIDQQMKLEYERILGESRVEINENLWN